MIGIDVSYAQGVIDWAAVATQGNVSFVYAKATEGLTLVDDQFARNRTVTMARSIPCGAYHFFHFDLDPLAQAQHFLSVAKPGKGDLLPMVDVEVSNGDDIATKVAKLSQFITAVERAIGGKRMLVYSSYGFWNSSMGGSAAFSGHPLWIAEYNNDPQPTLPSGWNSWAIWQYSDAGSVAGISGSVDLDRLNGDGTALKALYV